MTESERKVLNKKVEKTMDLIENKKDKVVIRMLQVIPLTLIITGFILAAFSIYTINYWYQRNRVVFQSPIHIDFYSPIVIEDRSIKHVNVKTFHSPVPTSSTRPVIKPTVSPTPKKVSMTDKETIMATKHGKVLWKIFGLETSWGKNDWCKLHNMGFGGFGVMNEGKIVCYSTFAQAVERADYWLVQNGVDTDIATALCMWNIGVKTNGCDYYQSYLNLN